VKAGLETTSASLASTNLSRSSYFDSPLIIFFQKINALTIVTLFVESTESLVRGSDTLSMEPLPLLSISLA
jgi:hypothetical protein